jgi:type II secretory pathway predicted ATPase ExeA
MENNIALTTLSEIERKRLVEQIHITFPRLKRIVTLVEHCHQYSKIAAEPECLLITGLQGTGKTTLRRTYAGRHPRQATREGVSVPVLDAAIPVPATVKSLVSELLSSLGDPLPEKGTVVTQTHRLKRLIRQCQVEMIVIDEFQHFIDRDSNVILTTVSNWLKDLLNETGVPMILIGMPYSEAVLRANAQLERRFAMRASLDPFGWNTAERQTEFRLFLNYLDERLPFTRRSSLADPETALRVLCATEGIIGYVMKLIRRAAGMAIDENRQCLDLSVLASAYDERLRGRTPDRANPFTCELENLMIEPASKSKTIGLAAPRRGRTKAPVLTAAEILGRQIAKGE